MRTACVDGIERRGSGESFGLRSRLDFRPEVYRIQLRPDILVTGSVQDQRLSGRRKGELA
jgi:hypothetical protein